ncbi:MAG TPA: SDR family oxidoreductase [Jatrophihabitantaceae bacterium]|nr:SDR family oxidoreductase [Jatrophihabitantaceae bacterium]
MNRFDGSRVFLTGAGSGIGRAVAARLAAEGAHVVGVDLSTDTIETEAKMVCDVTDAEAVASTMETAVGLLEGLDIVMNIAGIGHFRNSHEESPEEFAKIIDVNLNGTFHVCRYALPYLLANGDRGGTIVNTASTAGLMGQAWSAAYCASKGGVVMLTKALAYEYRDRHIRVNAVAPGGVNTAIAGSFAESFPADANLKLMYKITTPMGMVEPDEMANVFAFVASPEAHYMTGSIVTMDGGITA